MSLSATDNLSGVASTCYTINGGAQQTYSTAFAVSGDGTHTITYWSVDGAGNTEPTHTLTVKIDGTAPTLAFGMATPAPNGGGWNNSPVTLPYTASDVASGVATATPGAPLTFSAEGAGQTQTVTVTDNAGNAATFTSPAVNIDLTAPVTTGTTGGATVTLTATDNLSGVAATFYKIDSGSQTTYTAPFTVTGVGTHIVAYSSTDKAGNTETTHTLTVTLNPVPTLSSISPSSATAGTAAFTLTVTGTNFAPSSTVKWNGGSLATTYVSSTQLTASVPAADIASVGAASVTVANPAPGGGTSGAKTFTIVAPTLKSLSISPTSITGGMNGTGTVTLTGPAPAGGIGVTLASSSSKAVVPASVTVASGSTTATFPVSGLLVAANTSAKITATYGASKPTASITVVKSAPASPRAVAGTKQVTLSWSALTGAATYNIYRGTSKGGEGSVAYKRGVAGTSFTDTGLTTGTTYWYQISGVGSGSESGRSSEVSAKAL